LFQILLKMRSVASYTPDHAVAAKLFFSGISFAATSWLRQKDYLNVHLIFLLFLREELYFLFRRNCW